MQPEVLKALGHPVAAGEKRFGDGTGHPGASGSWSAVFGADADEYFQAWHVARFIGEVAAAGRAEYPLPLYVNVALRDPLMHPTANQYESGGATDNSGAGNMAQPMTNSSSSPPPSIRYRRTTS